MGIEINNKFGKLTVVGEFCRNTHGRKRFTCICDCGKQVVVTDSNLKHSTNSCGCLKVQKIKERLTKSEEWKKNVRMQYEQKRKRWLEPRNRELASKRIKKYRDKNREIINKRHRDRIKGSSDISYKLRWNIRNRFKQALLKKYKKGLAIQNLGCSIDELKLYLEARFVAGMSWNNYGKTWHIDHIIPLSVFNLADESQVSLACHYTNLQPLFAFDNLSKGSKT